MGLARGVVALTLALGACTSGHGQPSGRGAVRPCHPRGLENVGDPLPACSFRTFDGTVLDLTSLKGKPAVINFWASWCTFCLKEMPDFEKVHVSVGDAVKIIGADLNGVEGEVASAARRYAKARGVTYPLIFDDGGLLFSHFAARTILPVTIFVDAGGLVRYRQFGPLDERSLRSLLHKQLGV